VSGPVAEPPARHPLWAGSAHFDVDATAMRDAAAALPEWQRDRSLRLVEGALERFGADVREAHSEYAARRVATLRWFGHDEEAAGYLADCERRLDPGPLRERLRVHESEADLRERDWMAEQLEALRPERPSQEWLAGRLGPRIEDHDALAAAAHALRSAKGDPRLAPPSRKEASAFPPPPSALGAPPAGSLDAELRHALGPARFAEVDQIATLLGHAAEGHSEEWVRERRESFGKGPDVPWARFKDFAHEVSGLDDEGAIEAVRERWVNEHGALAAVPLHAEREGRRREVERAPEIAAAPPPEIAPDAGIEPF
jgi:hypothetical protein